jgi:hypothetical protein
MPDDVRVASSLPSTGSPAVSVASGANDEPLVGVSPDSFPVLINDPDAVEQAVQRCRHPR